MLRVLLLTDKNATAYLLGENFKLSDITLVLRGRFLTLKLVGSDQAMLNSNQAWFSS